jgi:hypothetical protein
MDDAAVREHAQAFCDALVAGDIDRAIEDFSPELRRNLGEVLAILPLPASEGSVESVEHGGSGFNVVIRLVGEAEDLIQTRWKDRDGRPTIVEASHMSRTDRAEQALDDEGFAAAEGSTDSGSGEAAG